MLIWNINSICLCWQNIPFEEICYLSVSPTPFFFLQHTSIPVIKSRCWNRKSSDSQYWAYWKELLLICLRCKIREDLHTHICKLHQPLKFWLHSASSPLLIILIYHNQGPTSLTKKNKSLPAMLRSFFIQCNFTGGTIAQIKLRESSLAWISTVIAEEGKHRGIHCLSILSSE